MTTETASNDLKQPTADELNRIYDGISSDWFLQQLVAYANDNEGFEIPLTLNLGGSTISGMLISGKKYFQKFAENFVHGWDEGEAKQSWYDGFATLGDAVYTDESVDPPNFIHMMDVRVHHPDGNLPSNEGVLWRGKVNSIGGFWLGQLMVSAPAK